MKYIRLNNQGRAVEIISATKSEFTKMVTPGVRGLFTEYPNNTAVSQGQVDDGNGVFIDYVKPAPTQEQINARATGKIDRLERQALKEVIKIIKAQGLQTPALQAIIDQVQIEKDKIL